MQLISRRSLAFTEKKIWYACKFWDTYNYVHCGQVQAIKVHDTECLLCFKMTCNSLEILYIFSPVYCVSALCHEECSFLPPSCVHISLMALHKNLSTDIIPDKHHLSTWDWLHRTGFQWPCFHNSPSCYRHLGRESEPEPPSCLGNIGRCQECHLKQRRQNVFNTVY